MTSKLEIVQNSALFSMAIYDYEGFEKVTWDYLETTNPLSIYWAIKEINDIQYVVFRGSATFLDWIRDFMTFGDPFYPSPFGLVHPGFHIGTPEVYQQLKPMLIKPFVICGHSKGAGEADNIVASACLDDNPPLMRCVFGEPRPGDKKFGQIMRNVASFSFLNEDLHGNDEITNVPWYIWPECFEHPSPLFFVSEPPAPNDDWGPFAYHHMQLYYAAATKLTEDQLASHHAVATAFRT